MTGGEVVNGYSWSCFRAATYFWQMRNEKLLKTWLQKETSFHGAVNGDAKSTDETICIIVHYSVWAGPKS